ncbi:MAG TPA: hypothetical protein VJW76_12550 [Verrucomicrobiae bacterium]|nr:hypothetical protein [Verrucomicrobiae bacterium]
MTVKSLRLRKRTRELISERLSSALGERDQGLLTQTEYEEKISEVELSLGPHVVLDEVPLRDGGTRFVLRSSLTGDTLDSLEYGRSWSPER